MTGQEKRGRPAKERHVVAENSADASLARINSYMGAILALVRSDASDIRDTREARFSRALKHLETDSIEQLARDLAHEVAFMPALQGLIDSAERATTGPKPKTAQTILVTQVRELLRRHKVELKQWRNARDRRTALADFCDVLVAMSGAKTGGISTRTIEKAPSQGFR